MDCSDVVYQRASKNLSIIAQQQASITEQGQKQTWNLPKRQKLVKPFNATKDIVLFHKAPKQLGLARRYDSVQEPLEAFHTNLISTSHQCE
jgi:hypothetical protein